MPTKKIRAFQESAQEIQERLPELLSEEPLKVAPTETAADTIRDIEAQKGAASIERRERLENVGVFGAAKRAFETGTSGYLLKGAKEYFNELDTESADPNWVLDRKAYNEILAEVGIQGGAGTEKRLAKANSLAQAIRYAQEIKEDERRLEELEGHGIVNFAVGMLDPVENLAILGASLVSGPAGAIMGMGNKMRRLTHATSTTGALMATMRGAEEFGASYSIEDYLLAGAIGGGLGYAFTPKGHLKPKVTDAPAAKDVPVIKEAEAPATKATEAPSTKAPEPAAAVDLTPPTKLDVRQTVKHVPDSPGKVTRAEVETAFRNKLAPIAGNRLKRGEEKALRAEIHDLKFRLQKISDADPQQYLKGAKEGARKVPARTAKQRAQQLVKEATEADRLVLTEKLAIAEKKLNDSLQAKEAQGKLDTLDSNGKLPEEWENLVGKERPATLKEEILEEFVAAGAAVKYTPYVPKKHVPVKAPKTAPEAVKAPEGTKVPDTPEKSTSDAVQRVAEQQKGMQGVNKGLVRRTFQFFNEFVSEFDKVTFSHPKLRGHISKLLDDPLRREGIQNVNASSVFRQNALAASKELQEVEDALYTYVNKVNGESAVGSMHGYSKKHVDTRLQVEAEIADHLVKRNEAMRTGQPLPTIDNPEILKLVEAFEEAFHKSASRASKQGLKGLESYEFINGYFPRMWNGDKITRMQLADPTPVKLSNKTWTTQGQINVTNLLKGMVMGGMPDLSEEVAHRIAVAIRDRAIDKSHGARTDMMGQLGKFETGSIIDMLRQADIDQPLIDSIQSRITGKLEEQSSVKYARERIPLDMTVTYTDATGRTWGISDLIDTDLSRLLENYQQAMAGRGALARVGIGGDDASLTTWRTHYREVMDTIPEMGVEAKKDAMRVLDHTLGDFTGVRPQEAVLTPMQSTLKATATAAMLGSMGVLQVGESAIIAARYTGRAVFMDALKRIPGLRTLLKDIGKNPELYKEFQFVTGTKFSTDTRMRSWKKQHEVGLIQDGSIQRIAYAMQQMAPMVTGQRWVHRMQSDTLLNETMYQFYKAAQGDAKAIKMLEEFGLAPNDRVALLGELKNSMTIKDGRLQSLGLEALSDSALEQLTLLTTRIQDAHLLANRSGHGSTFGRTAVGQVLSQFMNYVSMAHNKILRADMYHSGVKGIAKVLVYQYPMMLMSTYINEVRKGNILDLDDDADMRKLLTQALAYSSVFGLFGDVVKVVTGADQSRGVAALGILEAPGEVFSAFGDLAKGDVDKAAGGVLGALNKATIMGGIPGSKALENILKED